MSLKELPTGVFLGQFVTRSKGYLMIFSTSKWCDACHVSQEYIEEALDEDEIGDVVQAYVVRMDGQELGGDYEDFINSYGGYFLGAMLLFEDGKIVARMNNTNTIKHFEAVTTEILEKARKKLIYPYLDLVRLNKTPYWEAVLPHGIRQPRN
ncbi:MAG: hypothetical protein AB1540_09475 [Bdellovibrionota bacterium]